MGVSAFIFLLLFVVTGLPLQHVSFLHLEKRYVPGPVAEALYGITVDTTRDYRVGNYWVSQAGSFLYLDAVPVAGVEMNELHGVAESESWIWVAGDSRLLLLTGRGEVVEEFSALEKFPDVVTRLGKDARGVVVVGGLYNNWQADEELLDWRTHDGTRVAWSENGKAVQAPARLRAATLAHARDHLVSWAWLLADLHSGRLFGSAGVFIADLAAVLLLFLAATGLVLWYRSR